MSEDILTLIVVATLSLVSGMLLELFRNRIMKGQQEKERVQKSEDKIDADRKNFLASPTSPAWLTLIKTSSSISFSQKEQTDTSEVLKYIESPSVDQPNGITEPTISKFLLSDSQVIGRDDNCEICLTDSTLSRIHAAIKYEEGDFIIYDLGSKSGTYVNGKRLMQKGEILEFGDRLVMGQSVFLFFGYSISHVEVIEDHKSKSNSNTTTIPPRKNKSRKK